MSSITTGVGPISGLPINDLVESMLALQRRPITLLQSRLTNLSNQRTAVLKVSANLLALLNAGTKLKSASLFQTARAVSSNESALLATAAPGAAVGQYQFTVKSLAAAHQVLSTGYATADATPVGAGTITLETAQAQLDRSTRLVDLRGGDGIPRGKFRINDRAGGSTVIDLVAAVTVDDVIRAINGQAQAQVKARVEGDHLVLTDQTGLATGTLGVAEVGAGSTASRLGLLGSSATGSLVGENLVAVSTNTQLTELNDRNGIRRLTGVADFAITLADGTTLNIDLAQRVQLDTPLALLNGGGGVPQGSIRVKLRDGTQHDVDLSSATTLAEVKAAIESAAPNLSVTLHANGLTLKDNSTGTASLTVEELNGGQTAKALGLLGSSAAGEITGKRVYFVETLGDVIRVIHHAPGNGGKLAASISPDGLGLTLTDHTTGSGSLQVTALNNSKAAEDLGLLQAAAGNVITSRRLIASLNSVLLRSLNGGAGTVAGVLRITNRAGATADIDLSGARSLSDVIDAINTAGLGIEAAVSPNRLGVRLTDTSGGAGNLIIADLTGTLAADLGIAVDHAVTTVQSGNLQRQYVSTATRLADMRNGAGVPPGRFRITDSTGASALVDLTQGNEETLQDVIDEINSRGLGVVASINATGDGLLLTDTAGGAGQLKVTEDGGTTAKALGILGQAAVGQTTINGSFEYKITLSGNESLQEVASRIKAAGAPVVATLLRDPSSNRPWRLNLTSALSGLDGELTIDTDHPTLAFSTLVAAREAAVVFGPPDADEPLVLTSATNTLTDAVPGLRFDLLNTTTQPVTVSVTRDTAAIVKDVNLFLSAFNTAVGTLDEVTRFDTATNTRSPLTGDATIRGVRQRLIDLINRPIAGLSPPFSRLSAVGIEFTTGNTLRLDETQFTEALLNQPEAVASLFTADAAGFATALEKEMKRLTDTQSGTLSVQDQNIQRTQELLSQRIGQLELLVSRRRERLIAQFSAAESIIARLQSQQSALLGLSSSLLSFTNR